MAFRHTPYHMLSEALLGSGCPICALVHEDVLHYLDLLIHENVNDIDFRDELRRSGGFCNTHGWWLVSRVQGAALGTTIMYRDVLNTVRERLGPIAASGGTLLGTPRKRRGLGALAGGSQPRRDPRVACPACVVRDRGEDTFVSTLVAHARDERFLDRYAESDGVCLIHLDQALAGVRDIGAIRRLLEVHGTIVDRLIAELDEFQRKSDYRYRAEPMGREADAWQRAVELIDGKDGIR